jgi:hypothetical protein
VYTWNGTSDSVGRNVSVVEDESDHDPDTLGEIVGIGPPVASGSVRFTKIGPAGETFVAPVEGDDDETARTAPWLVLLPPPPFVPLVPGLCDDADADG